MKIVVSFVLFIVSLSTLYSCNPSQKENQIQSVADQNLTVDIKRFDLDFYNYLQNPTKESEDSLKSKYGDLLNAFGSITINNSEIDSSAYFLSLQKYFSNNSLLQIYRDELKTFENIKEYEDDLSKANILINTNFEGQQLPHLAMLVSGFKENVIVTTDVISISADKYLGSDYPLYQDFFEAYQRVQMQPKMLVRDYLKAWCISEFVKSDDPKNLLSGMISEGKILYILEKLLPEWDASDLIGYTSEQMEWCNDNEKSIWSTTIQKKYLYSTDFQLINKYINDAPCTAAISIDAPGRLGTWIGWQIVKAYAKNTGVTLDELGKEKDIQKILRLSKYNP